MKNTVRYFMLSCVGAAYLAAVSVAFGATFNLFAPASGVLKGNPATYVTTSATSTDVKSLWTGTCDNTTYLRGDGSCQTPPGAGGGSVNSVALAAPSVFGVAGSPVTNTGTLTLSFATGQTANRFLATPDGTTGALALRALVLADLPTITAAKGGTGVATLTGIAKGNGTSAFTAAASADVYGLWSGTCSSTTFLRGDGTCSTPASGSGTVTSVGLTVPSGFSVTGSPVTTSGTLGITGTLNPAAGGTGVATLTGIAKGNGTAAFSVAASGDITALWGGTCSGSTYLRGDGSCQTPPTGGTSANPSATIGLTAVNGAAGTFLRSDGAPALSQAIAPTWTGTHLFNGAPTVATGTAGVSLGKFTTSAGQTFIDSGAAANAHIWTFLTGTTGFFLQARDDAYSNGKSVLAVTRAANTVVDVTLGNATDNPTYTFAGSGTTTHVGGVIAPTVSTTSAFLTAGGNAGTPSYSFSGDTDTGLYNTTTNQLGVSLGGVQRVNFTSTGTTFATPVSGTALTVNGVGATVALAGAGTATQQLTVANTGGSLVVATDNSSGGGILTGSSAYAGMIATLNNTSMLLGTNGAARVGINGTGSVTINAPSSGAGLTVSAVANNTALNIVGSSTSSQSFGMNVAAGTNSTDYPLRVTTYGGAEIFRIAGSGAFGLGGANFGTSGQVLQSNGSGTGPTWVTPTGGLVMARARATTGVSGASLGSHSSGFASLNNGSVGGVTLNFTGSFFSSTPSCVVSAVEGTIQGMIAQVVAINSSTIFVMRNDSTGTASDGDVNIVCML